MLDLPKSVLFTLAMVVGLTAARPSQARRSSGEIRDTSYCRSDGCFSHDRSSGFYRQKLNSDGGIAKRSDGTGRSRRSRY